MGVAERLGRHRLPPLCPLCLSGADFVTMRGRLEVRRVAASQDPVLSGASAGCDLPFACGEAGADRDLIMAAARRDSETVRLESFPSRRALPQVGSPDLMRAKRLCNQWPGIMRLFLETEFHT